VGLLAFAVALAAPIWTWTSDGSPLRIGLRVPREAVADGLALRGEGQLQWRPLPVRGHGDDRTADSGGHDEVWIELAILAPRGRVQVVAGGRGPDLDGRGAAFVLRREQRRVAHGLEPFASDLGRGGERHPAEPRPRDARALVAAGGPRRGGALRAVAGAGTRWRHDRAAAAAPR
jgi:hypothetical protein